jgi:hypothetical protein
MLALLMAGAVAQTPSATPQSDFTQDRTEAPDQASVKPQTVRGCLNSAGDNYTVIDQVSGKTFKVEGSTDRLKQYIGQTVEITGSVKSVDGDSRPASASTGDILTMGDVKQVSDKCRNVPNTGVLRLERPVLLALMQRPVNDDANTQLDSSKQMSSNAQDTSAAASSTRSVTTNTQEHSEINVSGHTGAHGLAVTTSDTNSVGETTPPTSSAAGYATTRNRNDKGVAPMNPQAYNPANQQSEASRDKNQVPQALNPESIGASQQEGNAAAVAATNAEMQTDAKGDKTTFPTARKSEAEGSGNANPRENQPPSKSVKKETTPKPPQ